MKKIQLLLFVIISFLLFNTSSNVTQEEKIERQKFEKEVQYIKDYNYIYSLARIWNDDKLSKRYAYVTVKNCDKYIIDVGKKGRQTFIETGFKHWKKSSAGAIGHDQIIPGHWSHLLYVLAKEDVKLHKRLLEIEKKCNFNRSDNKMFNILLNKKHLTKNEKIQLKEVRIKRDKYMKKITVYFYRIGYNSEMSCIILSNWLKRYNGDYIRTLNDYNVGPNKKCNNDQKVWNMKYVNDILDEEKFHYELKLYHNWKIINILKIHPNWINII